MQVILHAVAFANFHTEAIPKHDLPLGQSKVRKNIPAAEAYHEKSHKTDCLRVSVNQQKDSHMTF